MRSGGQGGGLSTKTRTSTGGAGGLKIDFDAQTGAFSIGNPINFYPSGAAATISNIIDVGTTGTLFLAGLTGTPQDNDVIYESALGSELIVNGDFTNWTGDDPDPPWSVDFVEDGNNYVTEDSGKANFVTTDGATTLAISQSAIATIGNYYKLSAVVTAANPGSCRISVLDSVLILNSATTFTKYEVAISTNLGIRKHGSPTNVTIDSVSLKQITNAALANGTVY